MWTLSIANKFGTGYPVSLENTAMAQLKVPAETPLIQDAVSWYEPGSAANLYRSTWQFSGWTSPHGSGATGITEVAFADGHVKAMPIQAWVQMIKDADTNRTWK